VKNAPLLHDWIGYDADFCCTARVLSHAGDKASPAPRCG
jgi:hypothetical protein